MGSNSKNQKVFYTVWAIAWLVLAVCANRVLVSSVEAWFVTFPVAWTAALLVIRHRVYLSAFANRAQMKYIYLATICGCQAWNSWERGVRKDSTGFKMIGIMLAFAVAVLFIGLVVELVQIYKRQAKAGNP